MKIYTYKVDHLTIAELTEKGFEVVAMPQLLDKREIADSSVIIINGEDVTLQELFDRQTMYGEFTLIYIDVNVSMKDSVMNASKCALRGIEYLFGKYSTTSLLQILQKILKINVLDSTKLVGFFGSGTGVGTTTISRLYATRLAATGKKIVHLGLDLFDPGWDEKPNVSLDNWRPKLSAKILLEKDFDSLERKGEVHYLPGNFDYLSNFDYKVEEIEYLIQKAQEYYDIVVADFGSISDSAAWYSGLETSAVRFMVTNSMHEYRLRAIQETIRHFNLSFNDFYGIINKDPAESGSSMRDIEREVGLNCVLNIGTNELAEERELKPSKKDMQAIDGHVHSVLVGFGLEPLENKRRLF